MEKRAYDLGLLEEYSERQRADAERIVALCRALSSSMDDNEKLRAQIKGMEPKGKGPGPVEPGRD